MKYLIMNKFPRFRAASDELLNILRNTTADELDFKYKIPGDKRISLILDKKRINLCRQLFGHNRMPKIESCYAIFLDPSKKAIGFFHVSTGNETSTPANTKRILAVACYLGASSVLVTHNHPSGQASPSDPDKHRTYDLAAALALVDIKLLDHIIISKSGYYSFLGSGLLHQINQYVKDDMERYYHWLDEPHCPPTR